MDNDSHLYGGAFPDYTTHKIKKSPRPYLRRIKPSEYIEALERKKRNEEKERQALCISSLEEKRKAADTSKEIQTDDN